MSVEARRWADSQTVGDPIGKAVLLALCGFADKEGYCYPGITKIATRVELSPRTVIRKIKLLESVGLVVKKRRHYGGSRTSNGYHLTMVESTESQCDNLSCDSVTCDSVTGQSDSVTPTNVTGCHLPIKKNRQYEPSGEPSVLHGGEIDARIEPDQKSMRLLNVDGSELPPPKRKPDRFDEFWDAYPRNVDKKQARNIWAKATKDHDPGMIIEAAHRYALCRLGQDPGFTKHPHRWLKDQRFLDRPEDIKPPDRPGAALDAFKASIAKAKANGHSDITGSIGDRDRRDHRKGDGRVCESGPPPGVSQRDYDLLAKQIGFAPRIACDGKKHSRG